MLSLPQKEDTSVTSAQGMELFRQAFSGPLAHSVEDNDNATNLIIDAAAKSLEENKMEAEDSDKNNLPVVQGLNHDHINTVIRCSVALISLPVNSSTLHAVLRLLLRLTREHRYALLFAELGGTKLLLSLSQVSGFQGFTSLATLILRHVLEEPDTLRHTYEKVRINSIS